LLPSQQAETSRKSQSAEGIICTILSTSYKDQCGDQGQPPLRFPAAREKPGKSFFEAAPGPKTARGYRLAQDTWQNRRCGREPRKSSDRRYQIDNCEHPPYMMRNFTVARGRWGRPALTGWRQPHVREQDVLEQARLRGRPWQAADAHSLQERPIGQPTRTAPEKPAGAAGRGAQR
jgi:hypothetical protein